MNRMRIVAGVLVVMVGTGCPVGGDAGVLHQALLRDSIEKWVHGGCDRGDIWDECGPDGFDDCLRACEEVRERRRRK